MSTKLLPVVAFSVGLLAGCGGNGDETTDNTDNTPTDNTDETTSPTGETGTVPEPLLINAFSFRSLWGFDQATGMMSSITDTTDPANPETFRPYFALDFLKFDDTSDITAYNPEDACTVVIYLESGVFAPWATGDIYYGVDVDPVDVEHDCDGQEFGPSLDGIIDVILTEPIGVGVGVLSQSMIDIFDSFGYDYDENDFIGGYFQIPYLFDPPEISDTFGTAYEMNDYLETVTTPDDDSDGLDEYVVIEPADVAPTASGIPTAAYVTRSFYFYSYPD